MKAKRYRVMLITAALLTACVSRPEYVEETRTKRSIQLAFDQSKNAIYGVYARALSSRPDLYGKTVYRFTLDANGQVVDSVVVSTTLNGSGVPGEINQIIRGMNFGKVRQPGNVSITFPMEFLPKE